MRAYQSEQFAASLLIVALAACGGGGGDGGSSVPVTPFISIESPATNPSSQICSSGLVAGKAGRGTSFRCCTGSAEEIMGVKVTWRNETTGSSGETSQLVQCPFLNICDHRWNAVIPLVLGDNRITVTASDTTTGAARSETVTINKPILTYNISGTFVSHLGAPPGIGVVFFNRVGADGSHSTGVTSTGAFNFSCVPDGSYTLTPSSTIAYAFSPANRSVAVAGADVTGQSFVATAFLISGNATSASNGAGVSSQAIQLSGPGSTAKHFTDTSGAYNFLVPNGNYTLAPVDDLGIPEASNPPSRNVTVNNADVSAQNFVF